MVSAVTLRARAPCPSAAADPGSDALHLSASSPARAAARGGDRGARSSAVAAPAAGAGRPARPQTSLPQMGGGDGMPPASGRACSDSGPLPARARPAGR
eukprot:2583895-Pleurochrysis_carterae.AAC.1